MKVQQVTHLNKQHWELLLSADPSKEMINHYLKSATVFELMQQQQLIGIIVLTPISKEKIEIKNVAVSNIFQNQGFAQKLLNDAINYAQSQNFEIVEIGTGSTSFAQLYLYQKIGFRVHSIKQDFFTDNYDEPIYENKLELRDMIMLQMKLK